MRIAFEVHRDQRLLGIGHDAPQRSLRRRLQGGVDLLDRDLAAQVGHEVDHRDGGRGHAEGHAAEAPLQLGDHQAHGAGGARGGGHDVECRGAGIAQVLGRHVQQALRVGVRVHGGEQPFLDAPAVVEHLGDRGQPVGGAGGIGEDAVLRGVVGVLVDAEHDGDIFVPGRCGDDDAPGAALEVRRRLARIGEEAGRFDHELRTQLAPGDPGRVALGDDGHAPALDHDGVGLRPHLAREAPVVAVVLEQVGVGLRVGEVVDRHHLQRVGVVVQHGLERLAPDAPEAVNADSRYQGLLLSTVQRSAISLTGSAPLPSPKTLPPRRG